MKAVFFDAGGTLIHVDHARVARAASAVLGRELQAADFVAAEYAGRDAVERAMQAGGAPTDRSRWGIHFRAMMAVLGASDEEFERVGPAVIAEQRHAHLWTVVTPGTAEALVSLRRAGFRVACISNADGTVDRLLDAAGLLEHLEFVVDSGRVGVEKPDPAIFRLALEKAGVRADESLYVGDIWSIDVVGARRAGMEAVLLDPLGRYGHRGVRTATDVPSLARELVSAREAA